MSIVAVFTTAIIGFAGFVNYIPAFGHSVALVIFLLELRLHLEFAEM